LPALLILFNQLSISKQLLRNGWALCLICVASFFNKQRHANFSLQGARVNSFHFIAPYFSKTQFKSSSNICKSLASFFFLLFPEQTAVLDTSTLMMNSVTDKNSENFEIFYVCFPAHRPQGNVSETKISHLNES